MNIDGDGALEKCPQKRPAAISMQIEKGFTDNWLQSTGAQENLMRQYAGCKWFVWNRALSIEQAPARRRCASENIMKKRTGRRKLTKFVERTTCRS